MPSCLAIIPDCALTRKLDDVFSADTRERLPSFLLVLNENGRLTLLILDNVDSDEARQTLYTQGGLAGARTLRQQVLEAMAQLLGKEHRDALTGNAAGRDPAFARATHRQASCAQRVLPLP